MIMPDARALPFEVSSRHTSGGLAYEQGQREKGNPEPVNAYIDTMKGHLSDHLVYNKVEQYKTDNGLSTQ